MQKVRISKASLEQDIKNGMKREDLIKKYSTAEVKLVNSDITKLLQATGLRIRKTHKPRFELVDDDYVNTELPMNPIVAKEVKAEAELGNTAYGTYAGEGANTNTNNNNNN